MPSPLSILSGIHVLETQCETLMKKRTKFYLRIGEIRSTLENKDAPERDQIWEFRQDFDYNWDAKLATVRSELRNIV